MAPSLQPSDPECVACSKPIEPGRLVVYQRDGLRHVRCRQQAVEPKALEDVDRAQTVVVRAPQLREASRLAGAAGPPAVPDACPLCVYPATLTDWRPTAEWITVENCPCDGFFIWAPLVAARVRRLTAWDRRDFAHRIRTFRGSGHEAWLTTTDGTVTGRLVVRTQRSDPPTGFASQS